MKMLHRNVPKFLLAACLAVGAGVVTPAAQAQAAGSSVMSATTAINKAARLQMLVERSAKFYLQANQSVDVERSRKGLTDSIAQFDSTLAELRAYAPTALIGKTYQSLARAWDSMKVELQSSNFSIDQANKLLALEDKVWVLAGEGAGGIEDHTATTAGHLVNVSGRMRMLSQRMARLYQMAAAGVGQGANLNQLNKAGAGFSWETVPEMSKANDEFKRASQELKTSLHTPTTVQKELELVEVQWLFFETAMKAAATGNAKSHVKNVATTSERVLESLERIVNTYDQLGK